MNKNWSIYKKGKCPACGRELNSRKVLPCGFCHYLAVFEGHLSLMELSEKEKELMLKKFINQKYKNK